MNSDLPARSRRWWPQFSIRFLLVFATLVALPLGWLSNEIHCYHRECAAAAKLESEYGATLTINLFGCINRNVRPQFDWREIEHGRLYRPILAVAVSNQSLDESFLATIAQFRTPPSVDVQDATIIVAGKTE